MHLQAHQSIEEEQGVETTGHGVISKIIQNE